MPVKERKHKSVDFDLIKLNKRFSVLDKESTEDLWYFGDIESMDAEIYNLLFISMCYWDTDFFARNVCPDFITDPITKKQNETPAFHNELCDLADRRENILCIVFRGSGKTTRVSRIWSLKALCFGLESFILLISSEGLGETVIGDIRQQLETNEVIHQFFGNLVPIHNSEMRTSEKWRQKELNLLNGSKISTLTKGTSIRGLRPSKIIVDDPQENKDVRNPNIAREYYRWFFTAVYNTLNPESGSCIVLGTMLSENCFVNMLKQDADKKGFHLVEFKAIENFDHRQFTGESLWPDRWSMSLLKERYETIGHDEFMQEFQNMPMPLGGSYVFRNKDQLIVIQPTKVTESSIAFFDGIRRDNKWEYVFIGGDFANGGVGNDYTSIIARNEFGQLLAEYRGWITQDRACDIFDEMIKHLVGESLERVSILPETNSALAFLMVAKTRSWYGRIKRKKVLDKTTQKYRDELGFTTTAKSKPLIIMVLQKQIDENLEVSDLQRQEIDKFVYDESGAMNAMAPYHDDTVIANALSLFCITQGMPADATTMF